MNTDWCCVYYACEHAYEFFNLSSQLNVTNLSINSKEGISGRELLDTDTLKVLIFLIRILNARAAVISFLSRNAREAVCVAVSNQHINIWYRGTLSTHSLFLKPHTRSITFNLYYTKQETLNVSVTRRRKRESYSSPAYLTDPKSRKAGG